MASIETLTAIQAQLAGLLETMPQSIVQMQWHFVTSGSYRSEIAEHGSFAGKCRIADLLRGDRVLELEKESRSRQLRRASTILVLSCLPGSGPLAESGGRNASLRPRPLSEELSINAAQCLAVAETLLADAMGRVGIRVRSMNSSEMADFFYRLWNPELSQELGIPCRFSDAEGNFSDAWLCQDWLLEKESWKIGSWHHSFVSLEGKPQQSMPRLIERLTIGSGLGDLRVVLNLRRLDRDAEANRLRAHRNRSLQRMREPLSLLDRLAHPKAAVDPITAQYHVEARQDVEESNHLLAEIRSGKETQCLAQLVAHTWAKDTEDLSRRRGILLQAMSDMERARGVAETFGTHPVFQSALPGSLLPLPRWLKVKTRMAADLVPLHNGFETGEPALCVFRNAAGGLVTLDLFGRSGVDAPLAFVSGSSGSGKSFLVNQLLLQHMGRDPKIIILDIGGSYGRLVRLLGGQMVTFKKDRPLCLNPFQIFAASDDKREPTPTERARICSVLEEMAAGEHPLPPGFADRLDPALESLFCRSLGMGRSMLTLDDLARHLLSMDAMSREIATRLLPFTNGQRYEGWFNGPSVIDLKADLICFDLREIRRDARLCTVMISVLVHLMHDLLHQSRGRRKMLVMDEMWEFIRRPRLAEFVVEAWKTFRKENTATLGISQNLGADIADHPAVGAAILQNTETWFLLDQGKREQIDRAAEILQLTEGEHEILRNLRRGISFEGGANSKMGGIFRTALMIRGQKNGFRNSGEIRIAPTPREYWMATTVPEECARFDEVLEASAGNMEVALDWLARRHPFGLKEAMSK